MPKDRESARRMVSLPQSKSGGTVTYGDRAAGEKKAKAILGVVLVLAILGPLSFLQSRKALGREIPTPTQFRYEWFASSVVEDSLNGRKPRVPMAKGVDSCFSDSTGALATDFRSHTREFMTAVGDRVFEQHVFTTRSGGSYYDVSVVVAPTDNGPVLAACPAMTPTRFNGLGRDVDRIDYREVGAKADLPPGIEPRVKAWAEAFVADDPARLYDMTGDSGQRQYRGLGGWKLVEQQIENSTIDAAGRLILLVRLTIESDTTPPLVRTLNYDLLLSDFGAALPHVQAWAPAGSITRLEPYMNSEFVEGVLPTDTDTKDTRAPVIVTTTAQPATTTVVATTTTALQSGTFPAPIPALVTTAPIPVATTPPQELWLTDPTGAAS